MGAEEMTMIVCVDCKRFFKTLRNGVVVGEQMPSCNKTLSGTAQEEDWHPYKVWRADLLECRGCGKQIVSGFASCAMAEHYQPNFDMFQQHVTIKVNDCC
jgi:hypothetical protein